MMLDSHFVWRRDVGRVEVPDELRLLYKLVDGQHMITPVCV
jgi:hypothetical protein